jgi:hypothetical protein
MRVAMRALDGFQAGVVGNGGHILPDFFLEASQLAIAGRLTSSAETRRKAQGAKPHAAGPYWVAHERYS